MKECLCYQIRRNEVFTIYQHRFLLPNWHKMCSLPFRFHAFLRIWHSNFIPLSAAFCRVSVLSSMFLIPFFFFSLSGFLFSFYLLPFLPRSLSLSPIQHHSVRFAKQQITQKCIIKCKCLAFDKHHAKIEHHKWEWRRHEHSSRLMRTNLVSK